MRNRTHTTGRRSITIAVAACLVLAVTAVPADASPALVTIDKPKPLSLSTVTGSVNYLKTRYGVSDEEALRRLELQRTHDQLHRQLEARFADNYGGSWIDQDNGGVLVINGKNPDRLASAVSAPDRVHMRFGTSDRSVAELHAAAKRIATRFDLPSCLEPDIDPVANGLIITETAAVTIRRASPAGIGADGAFTRTKEAPATTPLACTIENCTPPMRGGLKLYVFPSLSSPTWQNWCTNGFNVKSSPLTWQWTLTAGHCINTNARYTDNNFHWVGEYRADTHTGTYPFDGAIMPYVLTGGVNYADYWLAGQPRNRVWAANLGDSLYQIKGSYSYAQIGVGWVACHTGAGSLDTRCGAVTAKDNGLVLDICAKPGDSGGPLFSEVDQYAYAVLTDGIPSSFNGSCYTTTRYSPLSKIFAKAQAQSGLTFSVNTN